MKTILALLLFASSIAAADEIHLGQGYCGSNAICAKVPNDGGVVIDVYDNHGLPKVTVVINGVSYVSPTGNDDTSIGPLTLYAADGSAITFTADLSYTVRCTRSGRGQHCTRYWTLESGTIER
jgi:hypothetical protein